MTKGELLKMLDKLAVEYCPKAMESVNRNSHMNDYDGESINQTTVDALIVDFVNYVGTFQGLDYAFYTRHLYKD